MKFLEKLKLLFKIRKPAGELLDSIKDAKRGWKTLPFWINIIGSALATAGALSGVISPIAQLVIVTALQSIYNILRGAQNMDSSTEKGTFRTTEFLTTGLTEIQKGIVTVQAGGINPEWLMMSSTIIGAALAAGQNLASRQPVPPPPPVDPTITK